MAEQTHKTKVHVIQGHVYLALPDDAFIKMTPEQARQIGGRLFIKAAEALGQPTPNTIILNLED